MLSAKFDLSTVPATRADATYTGGSSAIPITATTPTYDQILRFCDLGDDEHGLAQGSAAHRFSAEQRAIVQFIRRIVTGPPSAVLISEARRLVPKQSAPGNGVLILSTEEYNYTGGLTTLWDMDTETPGWGAPTLEGQMLNVSSLFGFDIHYSSSTDPAEGEEPENNIWSNTTSRPPQRISVNDAFGLFAATNPSVVYDEPYFTAAKNPGAQRGVAFIVPESFVTSVSGKVTVALAARHCLGTAGASDPYGRTEQFILCVDQTNNISWKDFIAAGTPDYVTADIPTLVADVIVAKIDKTSATVAPANVSTATFDALIDGTTAETTVHDDVIGQGRIVIPTAASLFTAEEHDVHFTVPEDSGGTAFGVFLRLLPTANKTLSGDFSQLRNNILIDVRASLRIG
jgi:hypothetical protein